MADFPGNLIVKMDGGPNFDGLGYGEFLPDPDKPWGLVIHTTETSVVPGYGAGVHPHYTYDAPRRRWVQHLRLDRRAGTLKGSSTLENGRSVPTNRAKVIQVEIVCYSDKVIADRYGRLWVGALTSEMKDDIAAFIYWLHQERDIALRWYPKPRPYGIHPMSHDSWWYKRAEAGWGICEHATAPDASTHWDAGAIDAADIMRRVSLLASPVPPPPPSEDGEPLVTQLPALKKVYPYPAGGDDDVRRLQALLAVGGFIDYGPTNFNAQAKPDGKFGPATRAAVVALQASHNLPPTGEVDSETWAAALGLL